LNNSIKENATPEDFPPSSVYNWIQYLSHSVAGDPDGALPFLRRWINEISNDPPETYIQKFHKYPLCAENLMKVRQQIGWMMS